MPSVKDLTLICDALNAERTFSEGDTLTGAVTMHVEKQTKVQSFFVKLKGDANVHWSEKHGDTHHSYSAHTRYFKLKAFLIPENTKDTEISKGIHTYKFSFKIPSGSMPSTFKGAYGKIVYKLEAKLSRSWKLDSCVAQEINFASKGISNFSHLMTRQVGSTDKAIGVFSKGSVHMEADVERGVYAPGETVAITVKVNNTSSKDMKPKFSLNQIIKYHARGRSKHSDNVICKLVGDVIEKKTERKVSCALKIPPDQILSIQNCDILSVEHQITVYLDISFSIDPKIKFPLVIVPFGFTLNPGPGGMMQPYPPVAFGGPSRSDFPPPAAYFQTPPHQNAYGHPAAFGSGYSTVPEQPLAYPAYPPVPGALPAMFPAAPVAMGAAYYNPMPQKLSPHGPPAQPSSLSPAHHPPPTGPFPPPTALIPPPSAPMFNPSPSVPPSFDSCYTAPTYNLPSFMPGMDFLSQQNEEPPSYLSIFPSPTTDKPSN
ncbi:unnamed protein product [Lota lota]